MSIALAVIMAVLGVVWWRYQHKAAAAHHREEQREIEVHGLERGHGFEKLQSELSRSNGWIGNGALWATLVVYGFGDTDRLT